ncbi:MAG: NTP transferase domain-containing protein [Gammaproteobacteria bacterium]|nr:NTP transferase domain-containing protein [Gammaproteobacteria bacterium]
MNAHDWAIVLAAGNGSRLRCLTTTGTGVSVPKQFCSLAGGPSLLDEALQRAAVVAPAARIVSIVAEQHRRWWSGADGVPAPGNVIVQPDNRGTANGVLLSLLHVCVRDRNASVLLLPSDHYVRDEAVLARSLRAAMDHAGRHPGDVVLLGIGPDEPDPELGYVVPGPRSGRGTRPVLRFIEKPTVAHARELMVRGALWNSFIVAGRANALLALYAGRFQGLVAAMGGVVRRAQRAAGADYALADLYARLPALDFSRDVLEGQEQRLRVLHVPACGWSDLGTVGRVAACLERLGNHAQRAHAVHGVPARLTLAAHPALQRLAG